MLFNVFELELPAGGQRAVVAEDVPAGTRLVSAVLAGTDALPLDDQAWAVAVKREPVPLMLVTEGNRFLETGLKLLPGFEVTTIAPGEFEAQFAESPSGTGAAGAASSQVDQITIFDAYIPVNAPTPTGACSSLHRPGRASSSRLPASSSNQYHVHLRWMIRW
jgi:hypothetical protein